MDSSKTNTLNLEGKGKSGRPNTGELNLVAETRRRAILEDTRRIFERLDRPVNRNV